MSFKHFVAPAFFGKLAKVSTGVVLPTLYIGAVLKAMYASPAKHVREGEAKLLSNSDIQSISARNKSLALQANSIMIEARDIVQKHHIDLTAPQIVRLCSELDNVRASEGCSIEEKN